MPFRAFAPLIFLTSESLFPPSCLPCHVLFYLPPRCAQWSRDTNHLNDSNYCNMAEEGSKETCEVAVPIAPGVPAISYDPDEEPAYGWVVCGALSSINGFTWGILAVSAPSRYEGERRANMPCPELWGLPVLLHQS